MKEEPLSWEPVCGPEHLRANDPEPWPHVDPITPEQLDEIAARADAATPGPWYIIGCSYPIDLMIGLGGRVDEEHEGDPAAATIEDVALMIHSREDVPALVAEVRRLQEIEKATDAFVNKALRMHSTHWWRLQGDLIDLGAMLPSWRGGDCG